MKKLQSARELLDQVGLACQFHIVVGEPAEMIVNLRKKNYSIGSLLARVGWVSLKAYC